MIIEKKIDYWKNKLLDLSKRNRMINFPELKIGKRVSRSRLAIYAPSIRELWETLVVNEESLKFPIEEVNFYENSEDDQIRFSDIDCFSTGIKTNQSSTEACKTLIKLKQRSREFMDNKGMNSLFLIFGFLRWKENGIEGQEMRSPLLLVPVTITQRKLTDPIYLSKSDDDPICNTALQQKLIHDFNINIPEYEDDMDIIEYLKTVEKMCKSVGWSVESEYAVLSMLNYLKMPMYKDIQAHEDKIKNHFLVRTLNGETSFYDYDSIPDLTEVDHDTISPQSVYSVVDADSSQQDAIYLAKNGTSFVLQGPPGTGKSQTITNIIAELLGQGKKVLFVSEKMAALQVVYRRLVSVGLGDFCLTLHNPNAKRKEIIEQLESSLSLADKKVVVSNDAVRELNALETAREELNNYVRQINKKILPLDDTIYHVNGIIAKYDSYPDIDYVQDNADKVTPEELAKMVDTLSEFVRIIEMQGYQSENPWVGCTERNINHIFRQRFNARTDEITAFLEQGIELSKELSSVIQGNDHIDNDEFFYSTVKGYEELLLSASICKGVLRAWFDLDTDKLLVDINHTIDLIANNAKEQKRIDSVRTFCRDLSYATTKIFDYAIADDADSINLSIKELNSNYDNLAEQISKSLAVKINYCKNTLLLCIQQFTAILSKVTELKSVRNDYDARISQLDKEIEAQSQLVTECNRTFEEARAVLAANNNEMFITAAIKPLLERFKWLSQKEFGQDYIRVSDDIIKGFENLSLYSTGLSELIKLFKTVFSELKEHYSQRNAVSQKSDEVSAESEHQKGVLADMQACYETAISKVKGDNNSDFLTFGLSNIRLLFDRLMNSPFD